MIIPYISREDVSAALSSLIHTTSKPAVGGLQHLLLVDLLLATPEMPESDEKRTFAVQELHRSWPRMFPNNPKQIEIILQKGRLSGARETEISNQPPEGDTTRTPL